VNTNFLNIFFDSTSESNPGFHMASRRPPAKHLNNALVTLILLILRWKKKIETLTDQIGWIYKTQFLFF